MNNARWQTFAWLGILVVIASLIYATNESRRRLDAWAQDEISRDGDVSSWPKRTARIARLIAAQEVLGQGPRA